MRFTAVSLLTFSVTLVVAIEFHEAAAVNQQLLITGESSSKIDITSAPYQISLQIDGNQRCGGSIISTNHVLTAAQCLFWLTTSSKPTQNLLDRISIRAGSSIRNEGGSGHQVAEIFIHENYTGHRQRHDLALLRVSQPFEIDANRRAVKLFHKNEPIVERSVGIVSGFGESRNGGSGELRAVWVKILKREECDVAFRDYGGIFEGQVCSSGGIEGDGPCGFDWGGPLAVEGRLAGIVALALGCNNPRFPAVYTEIARYRDWIDEKMEYSSGDALY